MFVFYDTTTDIHTRLNIICCIVNVLLYGRKYYN